MPGSGQLHFPWDLLQSSGPFSCLEGQSNSSRRETKTAPKPPVPPEKGPPPSFTGLSPRCCQGHGHRNPNCCSQSTWASLATTPRALCSPQTSRPGFQRCPCPSSLPVLPQAAGAGALSGPAALPLQPCPASAAGQQAARTEFAPGTNKDASQTCQNRRIWALLSPIAPHQGTHPTQTGAPALYLDRYKSSGIGGAAPASAELCPLPRARGDPATPGARPAGAGHRAEPPAPPGAPQLSPGIRGSPQPRDAPRPPVGPEASPGIRDGSG